MSERQTGRIHRMLVVIGVLMLIVGRRRENEDPEPAPTNEDPEPAPTIWMSPWQRGGKQVISSMGTGAVAFLAGFNLFTLVTVSDRLTTPKDQPLPSWSRLCLEGALVSHAVAIAVLILTLVMTFSAQMYESTQNERLAVFPEATVRILELQEERARQYVDFYVWAAYLKRATWGLVVGLTATFAGVACIALADSEVINSPPAPTRAWPGLVVAGVMAVAFVAVLAWALGQRPGWLYPNEVSIRFDSVILRKPSENQLRSVMKGNVLDEDVVDIELPRKQCPARGCGEWSPKKAQSCKECGYDFKKGPRQLRPWEPRAKR